MDSFGLFSKQTKNNGVGTNKTLMMVILYSTLYLKLEEGRGM